MGADRWPGVNMNIKLDSLLTTCCVLLQRRPTSRGGDASGRPHRFITMQQQVDHRLALFASDDERGDDQSAVDDDLRLSILAFIFIIYC